MISTALSNVELLKIVDEEMQTTCYGCVQEWYRNEWQRRAGCGPTVACTILLYLNYTRSTFGLGWVLNSKANVLAYMEDVWEVVTPGNRGIPTTKMLYEAVAAYAEAKGLDIVSKVCDVPEKDAGRPTLDTIIAFVQEALQQDAPVAFLNLCSGDEKDLDEWHWVTIVSMNSETNSAYACVNVLDNGVVKPIDLALWYQTTTLGGGFTCFLPRP